MSRFADIFADVGRPALSEHLGEAATYTAPDDAGTQTALTGVLVSAIEGQEPIDLGGGLNRQRLLDFSIPTDQLASVSDAGTMTLGSVVFAIQSVINQTDAFITVRCVRMETRERSGSGYRGKR